jgi:type IV secretory pathway TraG/TraD family ATPase VirD4
MSWIAEQKPKGKFMGLVAGSFLAYSWGHWHDRIISYFRFGFSKRYTQFYIVAVSTFIIIGRYYFW